MTRLAFVSLLLVSGCLTECGAVGHGAVGGGAVGGLPAASAACTIAETPLLHYAGRLEETAYDDGDPVTTLTDYGSQGYDIVQAVEANQPAWVASDSILGKPAMSLDGGDFLAGASSYTAASTPVLACVVTKKDVANSGSKFLWNLTSGGVDVMYMMGHNTLNAYSLMDDTASSYTGTFTADVWQLFCASSGGAAVADATVCMNGSCDLTPGTPTADVVIDDSHLGASRTGSSPWDGDIAEAILFTGTSLTELDVQSYLECIYGVTFPAAA